MDASVEMTDGWPSFGTGLPPFGPAQGLLKGPFASRNPIPREAGFLHSLPLGRNDKKTLTLAHGLAINASIPYPASRKLVGQAPPYMLNEIREVRV